MGLTLMYITNSPEVSLIAEKTGVERVWVDLETLGKEERQKGMNTVKSHHTIDDIRKIKPLLSKSAMLVRVNPWNEVSVEEIDGVVEAGADMIMLPMWRSTAEVLYFLDAVSGRCKTILLLETKEAVECLDEVLAKCCPDEIHIGLNDLHLSYGMTFMFELLTNGVVETLCEKIKAYGIPYGFGGVAKLGEGLLPAERVIMEHYRLGSSRAILSRTFCDNTVTENLNEIEKVFETNIRKMREFENSLGKLSKEEFLDNRAEVEKIVAHIVEERKNVE